MPGVAYNFVPVDREQLMLMPPSVSDWLAEDHFAWFVLDVVEELDLSAFMAVHRFDGRGGAAYHPVTMVALLVYAYSVGERSSRQIERRCVEDVAFRGRRPLRWWGLGGRQGPPSVGPSA
jgi:transposase